MSTSTSVCSAFVDVYSQQQCHFSLKIDLSLLLKWRYVFNARIYLMSRSFSITTFKKWDILNVCCFPPIKADGYQANLVTLTTFSLRVSSHGRPINNQNRCILGWSTITWAAKHPIRWWDEELVFSNDVYHLERPKWQLDLAGILAPGAPSLYISNAPWTNFNHWRSKILCVIIGHKT